MENSSSPARRVAFVTGASYGIGAAIALALARDGFDVAVSATRIKNVAETSAKLKALGVRALPIVLDVRAHASIQNAISEIVKGLGGVDVLVNNAGVPLQKAILDITPAEWEGVMSTNLTGTFLLSQAMGRHLIERGSPGAIINVASTHGIVGTPKRVAYGVSKAAVIHMTKMFAVEWAPHGIRVNAIAPGRVISGSPGRAGSASNAEYLEAVLKRIPLNRFCTVEDCAQAVRYLASSQADYITGHTLVLDGAMTIV